MKDKNKTKAQLLDELAQLRREFSSQKNISNSDIDLSSGPHSLRSPEMNRAILNTVPDLMFLMKRDGTVLDYKADALSDLLVTPSEFLNKNIKVFLPKHVSDLSMHNIEEAFKTKAIRIFEYHLLFENTIRYFEARMVVCGSNEVLTIVREITERKAIEKALHESENTYRTVFETTGTALIIIEEDTLISLMNREAEKLLGYSKEEVEGKMKWSDFVVGDKLETMMQYHIARRISPESVPRNYEFRLRDRQGKFRDIFLTADMISGTKKSVASLLDITERKKAELCINEIVRQQKAILNNIPDIAWLKDKESRFIAVNEPFVKACGKNFEYLIGKTDLDIWPNDLAESYRADDKEVMHTGRRKHVVEPLLNAEGGEIWIETIKTPIYNEKNEIIGTTGIARDITERKHAEDALTESESKFRQLSQQFNTLLDAIPDSIFLLSPELKIIWGNQATVSFIGIETTDMTGQYCYKLWHKRDTPCENCIVLRSLHTGKTETDKLSGTSGRLFDTRSFPVFDNNGIVVNIILIATDITEKIKLQSEAARNRHLSLLGELAAGVAHEINNPINGIINYAQLLALDCRKGSREYDIYNKIMKEGNRIANIINSLLSFSRDAKGEKIQVKVHRILNDSLTLVKTKILKNDINLTVDISEDLPSVLANPQQIQQVFLNIIHNAVYSINEKYPSNLEGKVLYIKGQEIMINDSQHVRVTFYDHGKGISAGILDKVMNPFFTTKPAGIGTGLGLSISHGIITDHGGTITINSEEGKFTTVSVDLPASEIK